jgi:hypothetical protein
MEWFGRVGEEQMGGWADEGMSLDIVAYKFALPWGVGGIDRIGVAGIVGKAEMVGMVWRVGLVGMAEKLQAKARKIAKEQGKIVARRKALTEARRIVKDLD